MGAEISHVQDVEIKYLLMTPREEAYSILEANVSNQGLEELSIRCNKCGSELRLTGFSLLQRLNEGILNRQGRHEIMQKSMQKNRSKKPQEI